LDVTSTSYAQSVNTFQERAVISGWGYDFSAWLLVADPDIQRAFLRITWLDHLNTPISTEDSTWVGAPSGIYQRASSGTRIAPTGALAARLHLVIVTSGPFTALADDASFVVISAPTPTAPPATPFPSPPPTDQPPGPTPNSTPAPATASPKPQASPISGIEPLAFDALTNGGFESSRADGSAAGWHKVGGEVRVDDQARTEGRQSLRLSSATGSTKWAYQVVRITAGSWIEASVAAKANGGEVFVRLSWYLSDDGSGAAIDNVDSPALTDSNAFVRVGTGAVQAPAGARTVKVRLMLRPASAAATAWFDDARLEPSSPASLLAVEAGSIGGANQSAAAATRRTGVGATRVLASGAGGASGAVTSNDSISAPLNDARGDASGNAPSTLPSRDEGPNVLLLAIILIPLGVIALILGRELFRDELK
jgi:hypothetical protein